MSSSSTSHDPTASLSSVRAGKLPAIAATADLEPGRDPAVVDELSRQLSEVDLGAGSDPVVKTRSIGTQTDLGDTQPSGRGIESVGGLDTVPGVVRDWVSTKGWPEADLDEIEPTITGSGIIWSRGDSIIREEFVNPAYYHLRLPHDIDALPDEQDDEACSCDILPSRLLRMPSEGLSAIPSHPAFWKDFFRHSDKNVREFHSFLAEETPGSLNPSRELNPVMLHGLAAALDITEQEFDRYVDDEWDQKQMALEFSAKVHVLADILAEIVAEGPTTQRGSRPLHIGEQAYSLLSEVREHARKVHASLVQSMGPSSAMNEASHV